MGIGLTLNNNNMTKQEILKKTLTELDKVDGQLDKIRKKYKSSDRGQKYIAPTRKGMARDGWVNEKLSHYFAASLDKPDFVNSKILDIGTGSGFFPFICNQQGHKAEGLDIDWAPVFNETVKVLNIKRHLFRIEKFKPFIQTGTKYDLITAHRTVFNCHRTPELWGADEWMHFMEDVFTNTLTNTGRVYIAFNVEPGHRKIGKEELIKLFDGFFIKSFTKQTTILVDDINKLKENYKNL